MTQLVILENALFGFETRFKNFAKSEPYMDDDSLNYYKYLINGIEYLKNEIERIKEILKNEK